MSCGYLCGWGEDWMICILLDIHTDTYLVSKYGGRRVCVKQLQRI